MSLTNLQTAAGAWQAKQPLYMSRMTPSQTWQARVKTLKTENTWSIFCLSHAPAWDPSCHCRSPLQPLLVKFLFSPLEPFKVFIRGSVSNHFLGLLNTLQLKRARLEVCGLKWVLDCIVTPSDSGSEPPGAAASRAAQRPLVPAQARRRLRLRQGRRPQLKADSEAARGGQAATGRLRARGPQVVTVTLTPAAPPRRSPAKPDLPSGPGPALSPALAASLWLPGQSQPDRCQ